MNTTAQSIVARNATEKPSELPFALAHFTAMPNESHVDIDVVAGLFGCGKSTVWAWVKSKRLPPPRKFGRSTRWNVGSLRATLASGGQE
ncbi:MAG: helix-turn-helix domain-containing protein [Sulfuritalea sp.]|nr:helix-turn-helix domain-containing protein [Sulfuritalea sp.]